MKVSPVISVGASKESARRASNPFKDYQGKRLANREQLIVQYLSSLSRTRAKFDCVTDLAKAVAEQLQSSEKKPCCYTTLLRNKLYRTRISNFMSGRRGVNNAPVTQPESQALIQTFELELSNTRRDNERLRAYILDLEGRLDESALAQHPSVQMLDGDSSGKEIIRLLNERAYVCKSLHLLLEHFRNLVAVDGERNCIIDLCAIKRKNIIIESKFAEPFLQWLRETDGVGK